MREGGAAVDLVTRHHVQRKRLVYHRLFRQAETPIWRHRGCRIHLKERGRCLSGSHRVRARPIDGGAFVLSVKYSLVIGHIVKLNLTGCAYRLTVAFFFTGCFADGLVFELA